MFSEFFFYVGYSNIFVSFILLTKTTGKCGQLFSNGVIVLF